MIGSIIDFRWLTPEEKTIIRRGIILESSVTKNGYKSFFVAYKHITTIMYTHVHEKDLISVKLRIGPNADILDIDKLLSGFI